MTDPIKRFDGANRFLSNFWYASVAFDGVVYPSVEHAFQAAKTLDPDKRRGIVHAPGPGIAKRLGRKLTLRPDWEQVKEAIMLNLLRQKFAHDPLRSALIATGDAQIIDGNIWGDTYWGVDVNKGGMNRLGILLMQVRDEIKEPVFETP